MACGSAQTQLGGPLATQRSCNRTTGRVTLHGAAGHKDEVRANDGTIAVKLKDMASCLCFEYARGRIAAVAMGEQRDGKGPTSTVVNRIIVSIELKYSSIGSGTTDNYPKKGLV